MSTLSRRRAVAIALSSPLAAVPAAAAAKPADDPFADARAAYAAWRQAQDDCVDAMLEADDLMPPTPWFQVTFAAPETMPMPKNWAPEFWPLTKDNIDEFDRIQPGCFRTPRFDARIARLRAQLAEHEAACARVSERCGHPEAERRRDAAAERLIAELGRVLGIGERDALMMVQDVPLPPRMA